MWSLGSAGPKTIRVIFLPSPKIKKKLLSVVGVKSVPFSL